MRSEILKLRNDPTANAVMAGAFTQANAALLSATARPLAERRRTLYRAFSRRRRRGASDLGCREQSECQRRELFSQCRAGQFFDFLRPVDGCGPQPRASARYSHGTLRCGGRGPGRAPRAPRKPRMRRTASAISAALQLLPSRSRPRRWPLAATAPSADHGRRRRAGHRRHDQRLCRRRAQASRRRTTRFSTVCFRIPAAPGRSRQVVSQLWGVSNPASGRQSARRLPARCSICSRIAATAEPRTLSRPLAESSQSLRFMVNALLSAAPLASRSAPIPRGASEQ